MTAPAAPLALGAELSRKGIHLATAVLPVGWGLGWFDASTVRTVLATALVVALLVELLRQRLPRVGTAFERLVGPLLRADERRGFTGATWLALGMGLVVFVAPAGAAIVALWAAAVGDASAAIAGRSVQALRGVPGGKSAVGSVAAVLTTAGGAAWLLAASPLEALTLGGVAALAEWPARPGNDNLRVGLAVALAAVALGLR